MAGANSNITVRLLADTAAYEAGMAKAGATAERVAGGLEKTGSKTGLLTNGLAMAGAAATAFGVMAVQKFAEFDASMSTVQANTGATASQMDALRQAAIDAGSETVYSASEAADGINELGKAGLSTTDILSGGLSGALNLAASDGMQVSEAAELMATTLKEFNLTGADSGKVADALAAGAGKAVGSAHDLGLALNQAGMVSHSFGISMQETTGTLAAFANSGMIGSDAGTSLKTMLIALANPTKESSDLMEQLGIEAYDAQGNFVGLSGLAGQLQQSMSGLSQEQRNQALATIFGSDAIRAANVLYSEGADGIDDWTKAVSESGYAAEQAAAKNDNLKGDLENLAGSMESLMISIGSGANGPLRALTQTLDMLVDGFSQLPAPVQQWIVLATAAVGGAAALHKALTPLSTSSSAVAQGIAGILDPVQALGRAAPGVSAGIQSIASAFQSPTVQMEKFGTTMSRTTAITTGFKSIGSGLLSMVGGPWGVAFMAATAALGYFTSKAAEAKQEADELTTAMQGGASGAEALANAIISGKWGDNQFGFLEKTEDVQNFNDALKATGITAVEFAKAAAGDKDALNQVNTALKEHEEANNRYIHGLNVGKEQSDFIRDALKEASGQLGDSTQKTEELAQANEELGASGQSASTSSDAVTAALSQMDNAASDASEQLDALVQSMFALPGSALSADQAITQMNQTLLESTQAIQQNGVVLDQAGNALAGHEAAAYKSQSALQSMASSAQQAAQKIMEEAQANFKASGNTQQLKASTDQANATLGTARQKFIDAATAAGMSRDAAERLADQYGLIPGSVETDIVVKGYDDAVSKIRNLTNMQIADKYFKIHGTYVDSSGGTYSSSGYRPKGAMGNIPTGATGGLFTGSSILPGYASGGVFDGYVDGPGTATSDSIRLLNARLAKGEVVQSASAVDYYGKQFMLDLNRRRLPREMLFKAPAVTVRQAPPTVASQMVTPAQIEAAMVGALKRLPEVRVFASSQEMALALAKPVSREISRQSDRGVR